MQSYQVHKTDGGVRDCGSFYLDMAGQFGPEEISVRWCRQRRACRSDIDEAIEQIWKSQSIQARRTGKELFNGRLCRLVDCSTADGKLQLLLGPTSFKEFLGTNLLNPQIRYTHGSEVLADAVGLSAAVVSADEFLVLGRRSEKVLCHPGQIHPIGGMLEATRDDKTPPNAFGALFKELAEELDLSAGAVRNVVCLGLVRDKHLVQPELIFQTQVDLDSQSLRQMAAGAQDAQEHTELLFLRNHGPAVVSFLRQHATEVTPVATATLLLHGLHCWGPGWFASACGWAKGLA